MTENKLLIFVATCFCALAFSLPALATDSNQPSKANVEAAGGAVMCLTNLIAAGKNPVQCTQYVRQYFAQRKYKAGQFDPKGTAKKRKKWLEQCVTCRTSDINKVQAQYGTVPAI